MTNDMQELAAKEDQMRIDKILNQAFEQGKEGFDNGKLPPFLVAFTDAFINDEDGIKETQGLLWEYINADEAKRNDIDQVVMALCGYSVPRLAAVGLKMAEGRDFNAAFAATEEDGFGIAMAHILMHRLQTINKQISTSKYQQANGKRANGKSKRQRLHCYVDGAG
jgi:hypothetical protein